MSTESLLMGALIGQGVGTGLSIMGQIQEGKEAEEQGKRMKALAQARAAIDIENAEAARERSVEEAKIKSERGTKLLARQKAAFAAGNVLTNVGSPLVLEAETKRDIAKDIGFILETGRGESDAYRSQAEYELAYGDIMEKQGKKARKQSKWDALATGLGGFGSMAYMGYQGGYFGGSKSGTGSQRPATGPMSKGYRLRLEG
ncbi:MAG: hypothetical protein PHY02_09570 [Phycisphaerae bacterium]|nr:hypothetical protein [Phycisphaerae bacterium]